MINKKQREENLILISIMSYYARQIFNGTKLYEFRKSPLKDFCLNKQIFVYSAKGDKAIIGTFKVKQILNGNVEQIMKLTGYDKRDDGHEIVEYYKNTQNCYALELYDVKKFERPLTLKQMRKIDPNINLPQYYTYIKPSSPIYNEIKKLQAEI